MTDKNNPNDDIADWLKGELLSMHLAEDPTLEIERLRAAQSPVDIEDVEVLCETAVGAGIAWQRHQRAYRHKHTELSKIMDALFDLAQEMRTKIRESKQ